jgi:tripartite-type tricarboxylate transporter receptor subunit TctC
MNILKAAVLGLLLPLAFLFTGPISGNLVSTEAKAEYPEKPITLLVGFRAGGRIDSLARVLGKEMSTDLGQPVVVTAKPGGGGAVMASALRAAKPDGYTLGVSVTITWAFNPFYQKKAPYGADEFTYISTLSQGKPALFSHPDSGWKNLKDLIAAAKKSAEPLIFVSLAPSVRLQIMDVARKENIRFRVVPARGGAAALPMILGKTAHFAFSGGFHHSHAVAGKVQVLAFTDYQHHADLPGVKTLAELGYESFPPAYTVLAGPKGIPAGVSAKIAAAVSKAVNNPKIKKAMIKMSAPPALNGPKEAGVILAKQAAYYKRLIMEDRKASKK